MKARITSRRRGVTLVESAIIYPLTLFIMLALVVGGMGVFRYQEVAALAREGARYASTHGAQYRKDANLPVGSAGTAVGSNGGVLWYQADTALAPGSDTSWCQDVYDQAVRPRLVSLDPRNVTCRIGWPPVINLPNKPDNWPGSQVTVTVTYQWVPELYLIGPINLTSTSSMPVTN
ncbi:MAG: pilus assembly protein [Gemmataceae bacterium]|nr:pilus assembly protein [Gemmataceae bacterium]